MSYYYYSYKGKKRKPSCIIYVHITGYIYSIKPLSPSLIKIMALIKVKAPYYYTPHLLLAKPRRSGFLIRPVSMLKKKQNVQIIKKNHHPEFFLHQKKYKYILILY